MMKRLTNIVLIAAAILFGSCASEPLGNQPLPSEGEVRIKLALEGAEALQARATTTGTPEEGAVNSLQLVIFKSVRGTLVKAYDFTLANPIPVDKQVVWDRNTQTITLKNQLTIGTEYDFYVIANSRREPDNGILGGLFGNERLFFDKLPLDAPTPTTGMVMGGYLHNHTFSDPTIPLEIDLKRVAAKVKISVALDPSLKTNYPSVTFLPEMMTLRILGVPKFTGYFYPLIPSHENIVDLDEMGLKEGENGWMLYLPENTNQGRLVDATQFILTLPYSYMNEDRDEMMVVDNYYLLNIDPSSTTSAIWRNTFYNAAVSVTSLGDKIPAITGTTITTQVLPWTFDGLDTESGAGDSKRDILELSNSSCNIYGDHADNILVGTVTLRATGLSGPATFTTKGTGFSLVSPATATLSYGTQTEIRIKTTADFRDGEVAVTIANETQKIVINRGFDHRPYHGHMGTSGNLIISDATWCTLAQNANDLQAAQRTVMNFIASTHVYINAPKNSLGNTLRQATIMSTQYGNPDIVSRTVVVQQPYITGSTAAKTQWATGNISLGYRPDGKLCYVIGAPYEHTLLFMANHMVGFPARDASYYAWNERKLSYLPSGTGTEASAAISTNLADYKPQYDTNRGDPCTAVYSGDPAVRWRSPTRAELEELTTGSSWIDGSSLDVNCPDRGWLVLNSQLVLPPTGRIGGYNVGREGWYDETISALHPLAGLWSSTEMQGGSDPKSYQLSAYDWGGSVSGLSARTALGVRCVRVK